MGSILLYIGTFTLGLYLDWAKSDTKSLPKWRAWFVIWLYFFLCFGYMTGSDWRQYELKYDSRIFEYNGEYGYAIVMNFLRSFIDDFWLVLGVLKCIYLYTLIHWLKKVTPFWLSVVAISGANPSLLGFMLINNPLRFMMACIFINIAMEMILRKKYLPAFVLMVVAFFFHNTTAFFLLFLVPAFVLAEKVASISKLFIIGVYVTSIVFVSYAENINIIKDTILLALSSNFEDISNYELYSVDDNSALFTVGNIINWFFFCIIVATRDLIVRSYEKGRFVYGISVIYMIVYELLAIVPTGFRLSIPLCFIYVLYFILLMKQKHILGYVYIIVSLLIISRNLWISYAYIPYTNSIYYIITEHKPYNERDVYNYNACYERTGKRLDH